MVTELLIELLSKNIGLKNIRKEHIIRIGIYLHESNLIEGFDSKEADQSMSNAWAIIREHVKGGPLTHHLVGRIQKEATAHQLELEDQWRGKYRDRSRIRVTIDGKEAMSPLFVRNAMDNWLKDLPNHTPKENHITFEKIHPFIDGNGRVGRLLMWWQERYVEHTELTFISKDNIEEYYNWFK